MEMMRTLLPEHLRKHEIKFVLFMAWILSPCLLTLLGFYLGTILGNRTHKLDLQTSDIHNGVQYAAVFFAVTIVIALIVTKALPPVILKDYADREKRWAESGEHHH